MNALGIKDKEGIKDNAKSIVVNHPAKYMGRSPILCSTSIKSFNVSYSNYAKYHLGTQFQNFRRLYISLLKLRLH